MYNLAPIVVFAYNRADHLQKTYEALSKNILADQSDLIVFSDGPKNRKDAQGVKEVREFLEKNKNQNDFKSMQIIASNENKGLAQSIISGVNTIIKKYHKIIVVEDDVETSKYFLTYMNDVLFNFKNNKEIGSAASYVPKIQIPKNSKHDVFVSMRPSSWAWGTWQDRWESTDFQVKDYSIQKYNFFLRKKLNSWGNDVAGRLDRYMAGHNNSWAVRFTVSRIKQHQFAVHPNQSLIRSIGLDSSGTNCVVADFEKFNIEKVYDKKIEVPSTPPLWDKEIREAYRKKYSRPIISAIGEFFVVVIFGFKKSSFFVRWAKNISKLIKGSNE
ncbi:sugar transferase [Polaribacter sp.]|nr:sugar transferase [Polaribacter sp.]